jgi:hypothetical protein
MLLGKTMPYIAVTTIAALLYALPALARPVDLICLVPATSMYFTVTFDEETGHVLFEGLPTTKEVIDQKRIAFSMQGRDAPYGYIIDGTSQTSSCKLAKKAF